MTKKLEDGCYYTALWVSPANWKSATSQKALKQSWYIQCKYFDPLFKDKYPNGFPFRKKLNKYKTLDERKEAVEYLLSEIPNLFENKGYNSITKKYTKVVELPKQGTLHSDLLIMDAFNLAEDKLKASKEHKYQIRAALNRFGKAVKELRMTEIKIRDFRRSELKTILEYLNLTDNYFNKFRSYLSSLFNELVEYDCCEINLTRDIRKRKIIKNQREVLSAGSLNLVLEYLKVHYYEFYRYGKVFFYSGARSTEILSVQRKHVRLEQQEYDVLIKKGRQYVWETKIIIQNAIPFWAEMVQLCNSKEDYLFSYGLVPGEKKNSSSQITIRWRTHVKNKIVIKNDKVYLKSELDKKGDSDYQSITADFYSLKHSFLDLLDSVNETDINTAKEMASHRTDKITHGVYTVGYTKRKNEILKQINV